MAKDIGIDQGVYKLAGEFILDGTVPNTVANHRGLATAIQQAIEDWFSANEQPLTKGEKS